MFCRLQSSAPLFGMSLSIKILYFVAFNHRLQLLCWIYVFLFNLFLNWWRICFVNWQSVDSSALVFSKIHVQLKPVPSKCNVLLCRSALVPVGGCEAPLLKVATVSLSRSVDLSPFVVDRSFVIHWHACC